jgi:hypothetical protein
MSDLAVHPVAALFPMLADDELDELAADIKQRGLLQPFVLDAEGRVLDGRNRLSACEIAGVEPTFVTYDGKDPYGDGFSLNRRRRRERVGAIHILDEEFRRLCSAHGQIIDQSLNGYAREAGLRKQNLIDAAAVLDHASNLREAVFAGQMTLQAAAALARERKRQDAENTANMARLKEVAPDLHALVDINNMRLDEALGALEVREAKARAEAAAPPSLYFLARSALALSAASCAASSLGFSFAMRAAKACSARNIIERCAFKIT